MLGDRIFVDTFGALNRSTSGPLRPKKCQFKFYIARNKLSTGQKFNFFKLTIAK